MDILLNIYDIMNNEGMNYNETTIDDQVSERNNRYTSTRKPSREFTKEMEYNFIVVEELPKQRTRRPSRLLGALEDYEVNLKK